MKGSGYKTSKVSYTKYDENNPNKDSRHKGNYDNIYLDKRSKSLTGNDHI